jgi:hypothetical protein
MSKRDNSAARAGQSPEPLIALRDILSAVSGVCSADCEGWKCNLERGHQGPCVAWDEESHECYAVWYAGRLFECREV